MDGMEGYRELRESAAWLELSGRGKIRMSGEDRVRLLHAMTTNHIENLKPGEGCYAFFLNAQGRILGDVCVFAMEDHLLLDTEPETREKLMAHLEKYIIADDVTLEDTTAGVATIGVEGPRASELLTALGAPLPEAAYSHRAWRDRIVARVDATGAGGFRLFAPVAAKESLVCGLEAAGAMQAGEEAARVVRLENGRPRYGEDITERHLPQETQQMHAVHFNKGCYLGQEIVERVRSRGHVNWLLVHLVLDLPEAPAAGAKLFYEGREAGEITTAAFSPALGRVVALAYVRAEYAAKPVTGYAIPGIGFGPGKSGIA